MLEQYSNDPTFSIPLKSSFWFFSNDFETVLSCNSSKKELKELQEAIDLDNENINESLEEIKQSGQISDNAFDFRRTEDRLMIFVLSCLKRKNSFWEKTAESIGKCNF